MLELIEFFSSYTTRARRRMVRRVFLNSLIVLKCWMILFRHHELRWTSSDLGGSGLQKRARKLINKNRYFVYVVDSVLCVDTANRCRCFAGDVLFVGAARRGRRLHDWRTRCEPRVSMYRPTNPPRHTSIATVSHRWDVFNYLVVLLCCLSTP